MPKEFGEVKYGKYCDDKSNQPILKLYIIKHKDGSIEAYFYEKVHLCQQSDFLLIVEVSKALYAEIGAFTLKLSRFMKKVNFKSSEEIEEALKEYIYEMLKDGDIALL